MAVRAAGADSVPASVAERARAIVSRASPAVRAAGVATLASLALADPAHADTLGDTAAFLKAFWEFRTGDPASFVALTVLPILGPYLIFQVLINQKVECARRSSPRAGGSSSWPSAAWTRTR